MEIKVMKKEIPQNEIIEIAKSPKILVYFDGQQYFAFGGICPHAKWPLELGKISHHLLTCAGHSWEFDISNGNCTSNPGRGLKIYNVVERDEELVISF